MATITIPCISSANVDYPFYTTDQYASIITGDDAYITIAGIRYYVGYQQSEYTAVTNITSKGGSNGELGDPALFLFQKTDVGFLTTSSVISAKFIFTSATNREYTSYPLYGSALNYRPQIEPGEKSGSYRVLSNTITTASRFMAYSENISANVPIEIDLSNDISTLINIISNGVILYVGKLIPSSEIIALFNNTALSQYQPHIEVEYLSDETPPIVTPSSPVSDVVNGDQPITFTWNYSQDVNEPQSHYSIQYQSSGDWTTLIPQTAGTAQTATVAANSLPAGQVAWRVMAWSQNGTVQSEWSEPAYIIVQSQPKAPNITNAGTSPSPTFTWQASQQQGYEIKLGDYYDAIQFGVEKSWTYPGTLPDGNVIFQIRIQNAQGIWSPWAGVETYISNVPQGTLSLSANVLNQSVSLTWIGTGFTSSQYNVYRDGELIATVSGTSFADYYSAGKHTYQVYAMLSGGYYTPSNAITEVVRPKYAMISLVSSISWIPLRIRSGGRPTYSSENQAQASFVHYQGRVLPVAYTTGFLDKSYSYSFSFLRKEDMQTLAKLCGQMVILKTPAGERVVGILTGISDSRQQRINDFSFSIMETDFSEVDLNAANNVEVSSFS